MSYDIYFIKSRRLDGGNIEELLESDAVETDQHFIPKELMGEIKIAFENKGLKFETFEGKEQDYLELNFDTFQVSMFNSQVGISLPYWDSNSSEGINKEVGQIIEVLLEKGFTGYDPQTERFISRNEVFQPNFDEVNTKVNKIFPSEIEGTEKQSTLRRTILRIIGFILVFLLVKFLITLASRLF